jgi:hypothetical protein
MRFVKREVVRQRFEGRSVALVGSGPGALANEPGFIDAHDVVVRVNNYKLLAGTGQRTDVFYSYFGNAIRKSAAELSADGVTLCLCKCPPAQVVESEWHRRHGKMNGVDFRWIYAARKAWWFCDTYVPSLEEFLEVFRLLGGHVPTTGFSALLEVLAHRPRAVYLTGFDFFQSRVHNVNEPWREKNRGDPICHVPHLERAWLAENLNNHPVQLDAALATLMRKDDRAVLDH